MVNVMTMEEEDEGRLSAPVPGRSFAQAAGSWSGVRARWGLAVPPFCQAEGRLLTPLSRVAVSGASAQT